MIQQTKTKQSLYLGVAAIALAAFLTAAPVQVRAQGAPSIGATDIGGVVTGAKGP